MKDTKDTEYSSARLMKKFESSILNNYKIKDYNCGWAYFSRLRSYNYYYISHSLSIINIMRSF